MPAVRRAACEGLLATLIAGCAGPGPVPIGEPIALELQATAYNAGRVGQAILLPQGDVTRIVLNFSGVPAGVTMPIHVYTYIYEAACPNLPARAAYALNDKVLVSMQGGNGNPAASMMRLEHTLKLNAESLLNGRYAIGLRTAPADGNQLIYCADLPRRG